MTHHFTEDELTLYYYGEGRRRHDIERHLESCAACAAHLSRDRGHARDDRRARAARARRSVRARSLAAHPAQAARTGTVGSWSTVLGFSRVPGGSAFAAAAAIAGPRGLRRAAASGRGCRRRRTPPAAGDARDRARRAPRAPSTADSRANRILLTSVADHLDRSERVLTDIMNAPRGDISAEQRWADDLLDASRLYRQDAIDAGERSVASDARRPRTQPDRNRQQPVEDQRGGSRADSAPHRRRLPVVQSAGDERRAPPARRRAGPLDPAIVNINTSHQLTIMDTTRMLLSSMFVAALAVPAAAQPRGTGAPAVPAMPPRCRSCRSCRRADAMPAMPASDAGRCVRCRFPCDRRRGASPATTAPTISTTGPAT